MGLAVVDAHLHLWDVGRTRYPWMDDPHLGESLRQNYLPPDFRLDAAEVDVLATVHVQAEVDHAIDPVEETAWLSGLAALSPDEPVPTVCVGYADLRDPRLGDVLDRHQEHAFFRGVRQEAWYDPGSTRADILTFNLLEDPAWEAGLRRLSDRGLSFDLLVFPHQLELASDVFSRLPGLTVILGHTGGPMPETDQGLREWRGGLHRFAERVPNAVIKLSGMSFISGGAPWDVARMRPIVREAIEIFGPERSLFSSNWPVERMATSYSTLWSAYDEMTVDFSPSERAALFVDNAVKAYRIPLPGREHT
jgi:predicted TIM-barrel fold metal-dependent hydrolase